jgi:xanthine dehydrogenase accessory factor
MPARSHPAHHLGILQDAERLLALKEPFTLCLVVHTSGSSYRKAGAMAIIDRHGNRHGVISGGCLESELESAALDALNEATPRLIVFDTDTDDDEVFGSGSGCRGRMQILLLPIAAGTSSALCDALIAADHSHQRLKVALITRGPAIGAGLLWAGDETITLGPVVDGLQELRALEAGQYWLSSQASCAVLAINPSPHIAVVGAGPEAPSLLAMAGQLGWYVTLCDHREAWLLRHGAGATRTVCARPAVALAAVGDWFVDACLIMTHNASADREALATLAGWRTPFIGLLGPPDRRDALLADLEPTARASISARLHGPVGLKLGGHGPEILSLSICAELQQYLARDRAVRMPDSSNTLLWDRTYD